MLHTSCDFWRLSVSSMASLRQAAVRVGLNVVFAFFGSLRRMWRIPSVTHFNIAFCHIFVSPLFLQCSGTQYARCTGFKQWTASGCLCGNKWRSALCRLASPNSCSPCTFRKTWAGKSVYSVDVTARFHNAAVSSFSVLCTHTHTHTLHSPTYLPFSFQPQTKDICIKKYTNMMNQTFWKETAWAKGIKTIIRSNLDPHSKIQLELLCPCST